MALSEKSRSTIYQTFVTLMGEEATSEMLSNLPALELDELVTKEHLDRRIAEVRTEIAALTGELKSDIAASEGGLKADIAASEGGLKAEIAKCRGDLTAEIHKVGNRVLVAVIGALFGTATVTLAVAPHVIG